MTPEGAWECCGLQRSTQASRHCLGAVGRENKEKKKKQSGKNGAVGKRRANGNQKKDDIVSMAKKGRVQCLLGA